ALSGVWNWRGTNSHGGKVALPDWESIALSDRQVYIVFDSDVSILPTEHAALVRLKVFLESRGARVALVYLPAGEGDAKVGLDDFFVAGHTTDELVALATPEVRNVRPPQAEEKRSGLYGSTLAGLMRIKNDDLGETFIPLTNFTAEIIGDIVVDDGIEQHRHFENEAQLH